MYRLFKKLTSFEFFGKVPSYVNIALSFLQLYLFTRGSMHEIHAVRAGAGGRESLSLAYNDASILRAPANL